MTKPAPTVVFFGDSITQGTIGASYVHILRRELGAAARVVNAGIDGDTTVNLLRRAARDVAPHRPDLVVVLVGLNDAGAAFGGPVQRIYYRHYKRVPLELGPARFATAYRRLIADLRASTNARIALCTLTTISEDPAHPVQALVDAYSTAVRALAIQECLPLIDLRGAFRAAIAADPRPGRPYRIWQAPIDAARVRWGLTTYAALTERRGFRLLCDGVHLAEAGAELAAATLLPELRRILDE